MASAQNHASFRLPKKLEEKSKMSIGSGRWVADEKKKPNASFFAKSTSRRRRLGRKCFSSSREDEPAIEMLKKIAEKAIYTRCYCEENVYLLCQRIERLAAAEKSDWKCYAVFISNELERCPVWRQRAAADDDAPCIWDYHVVCYCVSEKCERAVVVDLDTTLPVVCRAVTYVEEALMPTLKLPAAQDLYPKLRIVPGPIFLRHFASDRRHMRRPNDDDSGRQWIAPPPPYAPLCGQLAKRPWNLDEYKDVQEDMQQSASSRQHNHIDDEILANAGPTGLVVDLHTFASWVDDDWTASTASSSNDMNNTKSSAKSPQDQHAGAASEKEEDEDDSYDGCPEEKPGEMR